MNTVGLNKKLFDKVHRIIFMYDINVTYNDLEKVASKFKI